MTNLIKRGNSSVGSEREREDRSGYFIEFEECILLILEASKFHVLLK